MRAYNLRDTYGNSYSFGDSSAKTVPRSIHDQTYTIGIDTQNKYNCSMLHVAYLAFLVQCCEMDLLPTSTFILQPYSDFSYFDIICLFCTLVCCHWSPLTPTLPIQLAKDNLLLGLQGLNLLLVKLHNPSTAQFFLQLARN